ncbi:MAG TPA: hypothetical protein VFS39_01600 [Nitrospira sp.]|nr:hypothetical protein [Nitrospira sp.]
MAKIQEEQAVVHLVGRRSGIDTVLVSVPDPCANPLWEKTADNTIVFTVNGVERYRCPAEPGVFYYMRTTYQHNRERESRHNRTQTTSDSPGVRKDPSIPMKARIAS